MQNQDKINISYSDLKTIGESLAYKKCFKLPPVFNSRSKSFVTEVKEADDHIPVRKSILEKRSPKNRTMMICRSAVDELGLIEDYDNKDSDNETIYAVSEVSNASMEQTPLKVNLEPMMYKKKSYKNGAKIKKLPLRNHVKVIRN